MVDWKCVLKGDATAWLLENDNPSVRYFALRDLLALPECDPEVKNAKEQIMRAGLVPAILAEQRPEGAWEEPGRFYTAKYKGTVWQLIILAELGADGKDERVKKACEYILSHSQDLESGGFSQSTAVKTGGGRHGEVIPCLTGNMVWSLIRFGYLDDPRLQQGIAWLTTYQRFDDGEGEAPSGWPYDKYEMCWGKHTCHMGVVKALKALAEIPEEQRSAEVKETIEKGAEFLLIHHVHKRSHNLRKLAKPGWQQFGFPLMYQTDVLEILGILTKLGYRDERMNEAIDLLVSKQDENGRWKLENTFNGKFQVDIERNAEPSKWITLNALRVLKRYCNSSK
ncbi:nitrogen fixation protein NifH [Methanocella sp. MCL-LM]|uniref:nitrogen fixation protein NifH n=1 Tax=Methanocella sp. MCL-LM TaxID=3412035 RepID=UPI003C776326